MADSKTPAKKKTGRKRRKSTIALLLGAGKTTGQHPTHGGQVVDQFGQTGRNVGPVSPGYRRR
jgi:hypothetical protein